MSWLRRELNKDRLERVFESSVDAATGNVRQHIAFRPSLIRYNVDGETFEKQPDADDRERIRRIAQLSLPTEVPTNRLPVEDMYHGSRLAPKGVTHVHHFFLPRAAHSLAAMWRRANTHVDIRVRHMLLYFVEQAIWGMSILNRYGPTHYSQVNRQLTGVYYVSSQISEVSPRYNLGNKLSRLVKNLRPCTSPATLRLRHDREARRRPSIFPTTRWTTSSPTRRSARTSTTPISIFLVESWHGVLTNAAPEAIVDRFKKKGLLEYQRLMQRCFEEYQRVLKPGRWITVVFHNSRNAVWTAIQEAMLAAGFVVADVRTMDKQQGSYRQVTSTAVKQDLVISAYKPNDGLEERFTLTSGTEEGVWDFLRTHLGQLPVFVAKDGRVEVVNERQPHLLFDRMVAFHVLRNVTLPLSIGEFLAGLVRRFPERDGMVFLLEQVAEYDKKALGGRGGGATRNFRHRRILRHPVAEAAIGPQAPELPGHSPAIPPRDRGLAEARDAARAVPRCWTRTSCTTVVPARFRARSTPIFPPTSRSCAACPRTIRPCAPRPGAAGTCPTPTRRPTWRCGARAFFCVNSTNTAESPQRRLKLFRLEAVRAGFFKAYQDRDYETIIAVAEKIPVAVLQEDQKLLLWYDQALTRMEAA